VTLTLKNLSAGADVVGVLRSFFYISVTALVLFSQNASAEATISIRTSNGLRASAQVHFRIFIPPALTVSAESGASDSTIFTTNAGPLTLTHSKTSFITDSKQSSISGKILGSHPTPYTVAIP
jgi:hypothetical protein